MRRVYRLALPILSLALISLIVLSWPAVQDDALIHLRYADNLYLHHIISYDGVHSNYGTSSLLYVSLLAALRNFTASPNLARATSSGIHVLLFAGLATLLAIYFQRSSRLSRLLGVVLLVLLVVPSAVRWLDDGMETGLVLVFVAFLCWSIFRQTLYSPVSARSFLLLTAVGFFAVLLRTELLLLCGVGTALIVLSRPLGADKLNSTREFSRVLLQGSHLLLGGLLACGAIVWKMHVLLPDTAVAKSHGLAHWFGVLHATAITLAGALSFGLGMFSFWLLTLTLLVLQARRLSRANLLANLLFPIVLVLAALRGQEIQGVRYFTWTFLFSALWNTLQLAQLSSAETARRGSRLLYAFLVLLSIGLPFEGRTMYRVLTQRGSTMYLFEGQHLEVLQGEYGAASDIGYIGYFSKAEVCDLAGLVNGRAAARATSLQRLDVCVRNKPEFLFGNVSQLAPLAAKLDLNDWQICGQYDFSNMTTLDRHYLVVPPAAVDRVCRSTGRAPLPLQSVMKLSERSLNGHPAPVEPTGRNAA